MLAGSGALAAAACAALFVIGPWRTPDLSENELAAMLIEWHEDAVSTSILPSDGIQLEDFERVTPAKEPSAVDELLYGGEALKTL
jgi:hypothetical protein